MSKVGLPDWIIDKPQVELPLRQFRRVIAQPEIETVRILLRLLVPAAGVVAILHHLHVLVSRKLRSDTEHLSPVERRAHDGDIKVSPCHQAHRSAPDNDGVADGTKHPLKVKLHTDLLGLCLECSLPVQEFGWLVGGAICRVDHHSCCLCRGRSDRVLP